MEIDPDLRADLIRDHDLRPRNYEVLQDATSTGYNYNPRCGDKYTVYLQVVADRLAQVRFMGWGCAVSKASASIMCASVEGLSVQAAQELIVEFRKMVAGEPHQLDADAHFDLFAFVGIHQNPMRLHCATLAWGALAQALGAMGPVPPSEYK